MCVEVPQVGGGVLCSLTNGGGCVGVPQVEEGCLLESREWGGGVGVISTTSLCLRAVSLLCFCHFVKLSHFFTLLQIDVTVTQVLLSVHWSDVTRRSADKRRSYDLFKTKHVL